MQNNLIAWATIAGGVAGLFSFIYLVYEKLTKKPKIIFEILNIHAHESPPSSSDSFYRYFLDFDMEIGNVGTEMTTAIRTELFIFELNTNFHCRYGGSLPGDKSEYSLLLEPGFAGHFNMRQSMRIEKQYEGNDLSGVIKIKLLGGKMLQKKIKFKVKRYSN